MIKRIKNTIGLALVLVLITVSSLIPISTSAQTDDQIMDLESQKCFNLLWNESNGNTLSNGYGLTKDRYPSTPTIASTGSTGFALSAIVIGVERGWITWQQGYDRALGTLNTLYNNVANVNGVFYHFVNIDTGLRYGTSEVSIIDTALCINGALTAGEYFGSTVKTKADQVYQRVNWNWFRDPAVNQFYMGYLPESGFSGHWDYFGEQLQLYFLATASPNYSVPASTYTAFTRHKDYYYNIGPIVHSWFGSIFTYQYSHAWFDLRNTKDANGAHWWENSALASWANRQFCIDSASTYSTYGANSWGLTACDSKNGYNGYYGAPASGAGNTAHVSDGTIAPTGGIGSIVFMPTEVKALMQNFYNNYPSLWDSTYGFKDSFNTAVTPNYYATDFITIDKGTELLMIENYRTGKNWTYFMKNKYVQAGMKKCGVINTNTTFLEDHDGNGLGNWWTDGGNGVYTLTSQATTVDKGLYSLKVAYNKGTYSYPYFYKSFNNVNLSNNVALKMRVYGNVNLTLKFEVTGGATYETTVNMTGGNNWQDLNWDISGIRANLTSVTKLDIFAQPSQTGVNGIFYLDEVSAVDKSALAQIEAESYNSQVGTTIGTCAEGGSDVVNIDNGDYLVYNNVDFGASTPAKFQARVASGTTGGTIQVRLDSLTGTLLGTLSCGGTGGWGNYVLSDTNLSSVKGVHTVYLKFSGGLNINWFKFMLP